MDIFKDSCDHDSTDNLELERFKAKIREIWTRMLEETYAKYPVEGVSKEHYMEHNALRFADEPEPEDELDNLMEMLNELLDSKEELDSVDSEGKAPTYKGSDLKSNNEKGNIEATVYEVNHKSTKTPSDSRSGGKGGSYEGTPSGSISKKKDARVIRSFAPLGESFKEELKALVERQAIGKRRQLFR
mgnify:CR=1 FL=1|jgi:hypothetical protein|tara:strand:+ start:516 stop:1076 length:561 start_codon:yes stop_codon:yes gene_type:complete